MTFHEIPTGSYTFNRQAMLLTHNGQKVDALRKTLDCIHYLIENRDRVVDYGELIQKLWEHASATNDQLSYRVGYGCQPA